MTGKAGVKRMYYMTSAKWAQVILKERRLKLSTIPELNDPFELLGASIGEKDTRRLMRVLHAHWVKTIGMVCFSDTWRSPVMWAHYGDKHRGICLGFDVIDAELFEVQYKPDRLKNMLREVVTNRAFALEQFQAILTTKYEDWQYEHEHRLFASLDEREPTNGLYYLNFEPHLKLKEVIVGARCELSVGAAAKAVGKDVPSLVTVFKARPAFDSFKIVRQLRGAAITVKPKR